MAQNDTDRRAGPRTVSGTAERRNAEREAFSAVAQLREPQSRARMSVRIADISDKGCYADDLGSTPVGTKVVILIDQWIGEVRGEVSGSRSSAPLEGSVPTQKQPRTERHTISRSMNLMINKNLNSQAEGADLLEDHSQE